ncbi:hypothetical protein V6N12_016218 [Hibiscus sabdariffa]|uniref:Uncharacterized protein n=1 Tax=Hibiscus sabdariffa TaxID=183260 RepID=A0ABR2C929_9ROSI
MAGELASAHGMPHQGSTGHQGNERDNVLSEMASASNKAAQSGDIAPKTTRAKHRKQQQTMHQSRNGTGGTEALAHISAEPLHIERSKGRTSRQDAAKKVAQIGGKPPQ